MVAVFFPSKRMSIHMAAGAARDLFVFIELLELYAIGFLPAAHWLRPRFWTAWLRRWREVVFYLGLAGRLALARGDQGSLAAAVPRIS
jgi:hypothetical protein